MLLPPSINVCCRCVRVKTSNSNVDKHNNHSNDYHHVCINFCRKINEYVACKLLHYRDKQNI